MGVGLPTQTFDLDTDHPEDQEYDSDSSDDFLHLLNGESSPPSTPLSLDDTHSQIQQFPQGNAQI